MKNRVFSLILTTHGLFAVIAVIFGTIFVTTIPPMWGVDETEHFARVYQISQGNFVEDKVIDGYGGKLPAPVVDLYVQTKYDLLHKPSQTKSINDYAKYKVLMGRSVDGALKELNFTGAGIYSPVAYAAPTLGVITAHTVSDKLGNIILGARLATLILYIVITGLALYILRETKLKWLFFAVALLPMSIVQASVVSVDSPVIALSILLFACIYKFNGANKSVSPKQLLLVSFIASALTLTKPNYFILALLALILLTKLHTIKQRILASTVFMFITLLPALVWTKIIKSIEEVMITVQRGPTFHTSIHDQLTYILVHPITYILTMIKSFITADWLYSSVAVINFNFVRMPSLVLVIAVITITLSAIYIGYDSLRKSEALLYLTVAMVAAIGVVTTLYLTFNQIGANSIQGVQGRYFIPILPLLTLGFIKFIPIKLDTTPKVMGTMLTVLCVFNLGITAILYHLYTF